MTAARSSAYARRKIPPVAAFPAHWAPNAMVLYDKKQFPARYRNGVFIAFHGSWNRAPYPQGGYNVVFQPLTGDHASGQCEIFADGFAGAVKSPEKPCIVRPAWRSVRTVRCIFPTMCADESTELFIAAALAGAPRTSPRVQAHLLQPEDRRKHRPNLPRARIRTLARGDANLPVPEGATTEMVALGERIYHGEVADAACAGCHGDSGQGSPLGPDLTARNGCGATAATLESRKR